MSKLTAIACEKAKPQEKPYRMADGNGLYLVINPNGKKFWRYSFRFAGKANIYSIGSLDYISLAEAREKHRIVYKMVKEGQNPNEAKRKQKLKLLTDIGNTFQSVGDKWLEHKKSEWSEDHLKTVKTRLERDLYPKLGNLPVVSFNTPTVYGALKAIEARGVYETTKRAKQYISQILCYAMTHGIETRDYTKDLMRGALKHKKVKHHAAFSPDQLPEFLKRLNANEARLYPQTIIATKLLLLTMVRTNELIRATWKEFDLKKKTWTIPAERMKMRRPHVVPLSNQVITLLVGLRAINGQWDYILPGVHAKNKHMSDSTILTALYRLGYKGVATGHGFRSTSMTTLMENVGYEYDIPDSQLAHSKGKGDRPAYDRTQYLKERKIMMQDWADYIDRVSIEATNNPAVHNVIKLASVK